MLGQRSLADRVVKTSVIIMVGFLALGMGILGGEEPTNIPEPADNFSATVIDQVDVSSDITLFSFEGQTSLSGRHGGAVVSIFFDKIQEIDFYKKGDDLFAMVIMGKGTQIELKMDKGRTFYGQLPYGLFSIKTADVKKIIIKGLTQQDS